MELLTAFNNNQDVVSLLQRKPELSILLRPDLFEEAFIQMDTDETGTVSYEEFVHFVTKEARDQVLKYYNRDNSNDVKGTDNCDEEQIQQTRSRTALTHKGPSSRLFRRCLRKRLQ